MTISHRKATLVISTDQADFVLWLNGTAWQDVKHFQRPLSGYLKIGGRGLRLEEAKPAYERWGTLAAANTHGTG